MDRVELCLKTFCNFHNVSYDSKQLENNFDLTIFVLLERLKKD